MLLVIFVVVIAMVIILHGRVRKKQKAAGLSGWVKSQDLDGKGQTIYRDHANGISAKPDVVEQGKVIEYKSAPAGDRARRSDVLQITAQMMATGARKGELRYGNNKRFEFTRDESLIESSLKRIKWISRQMEWHLRTRSAPGGTPRPGKCAKCSYKNTCPDASKAA